ncbi:MAG: molybdopterin dinucleotide binding domain-containing protein, partial [Paracoccus sp. (in: a-proteobacteria)]|nr:molybdopterin dinucleotide binding domain-containing protein [Paracoccus sp. (in: a-proteobacteria)]
SRHLAEPYLEIHPADAERLGLGPAALASVTSPSGRAILRVLISDRVAQGHPFAPMHWTGNSAPSGRVDALVSGLADPVSGQPASKSTPVAITPFTAAWYGFAISTRDATPDCAYWAKAPVPGGFRLELAGDSAPKDWPAWAAHILGGAPTAQIADPARGMWRFGRMEAGRVLGALYIAPAPILLARDYLAELLGSECPTLLAGRPAADQPDPGPTICACLNIGLNTILGAISGQRLISVAALGKAIGAGTNCGSCRPELARLLQADKGTGQTERKQGLPIRP